MSTVKIPLAPAESPAALQSESLSFGAALTQLEALVEQLEGDAGLDLDAALQLYERGAALAAACRERLRSAELRLAEIATSSPPLEPAGPPESAGT